MCIIVLERETFMKYETCENETYNLYTIETDKFKSVHVEVVFKTKASKENITYLSMLADMLMENSNDYPSRKLLERKRCDLYSASVYATNTRVGNIIITNFVLDFVDPKYTSKDMYEESIKLLFQMINNPNAKEGEFDEDTFLKVKRRIKADIEALKEDPKQSSILKAFEHLDSNDIRSMSASGDISVLESITPRKLYKFYLDFLENSARDVYVIGAVEAKMIDKLVRKYANFKSIPTERFDVFLKPYKVGSAKNSVEKGAITQTQLVLLYTLKELTDDEENYVLPLYNMIWGSGSLESKLYKSLRGENSLCYNVSTFYQKYDNVVILHTAIDEANYRLAIKLINTATTAMAKGLFSEEELENAKNIMITSLNMVLDSPNRLIDNLVFKNLVGLPDLEDRIDAIKNVGKKDIVEVAKKIKNISTFRVKGE
ncbi:MAG TPA: hypothetical protein DCY94_03635 [Firmicutes bacterium]|nr:hypothetical protein [Bacillota bacterium]